MKKVGTVLQAYTVYSQQDLPRCEGLAKKSRYLHWAQQYRKMLEEEDHLVTITSDMENKVVQNISEGGSNLKLVC